MRIFPQRLKRILREIPSLSSSERKKVYHDLKSRYGYGGINTAELKGYLKERYRDKTDQIEPHEIDDILERFEREK